MPCAIKQGAYDGRYVKGWLLASTLANSIGPAAYSDTCCNLLCLQLCLQRLACRSNCCQDASSAPLTYHASLQHALFDIKMKPTLQCLRLLRLQLSPVVPQRCWTPVRSLRSLAEAYKPLQQPV